MGNFQESALLEEPFSILILKTIQNTFDFPVGDLNNLCLPLGIEYAIYSVAQRVALEPF